MHVHGDDYDCDPCDTHDGTKRRRRNSYLSDTFGEYYGFWWRQGEYWNDVVGRFMCGDYRLEDWPRDLTRYWDDWMANYQRYLQFPHRKANIGHVPNVVFVLDADGEGSTCKEVPVWFSVPRHRPTIGATPLRAIGGGPEVARPYVRGDFDERRQFVKIRLVAAADMGPVNRPVHLVSTVYTDDTSRHPIAVVHVIKLPASASEERDERSGHGRRSEPERDERSGHGFGRGRPSERKRDERSGHGFGQGGSPEFELPPQLREEIRTIQERLEHGMSNTPGIGIEALQQLSRDQKRNEQRFDALEQSSAAMSAAMARGSESTGAGTESTSRSSEPPSNRKSNGPKRR